MAATMGRPRNKKMLVVTMEFEYTSLRQGLEELRTIHGDGKATTREARRAVEAI
jgi:hypothetical protein